MRAARRADRRRVVGTEVYQSPAEAVLLIAFMIPWNALWLVLLTNYRGWLDRTAERYARGWWARRVTGWTAESYRLQTRIIAVPALAVGLFVLVAEGIGVLNGRIG
jgi:hypothetical protein